MRGQTRRAAIKRDTHRIRQVDPAFRCIGETRLETGHVQQVADIAVEPAASV